jgi:hypothetical protein
MTREESVAAWLTWCGRVRPAAGAVECARAAWTHAGLPEVDRWSTIAQFYVDEYGARLDDLLYAFVVVFDRPDLGDAAAAYAGGVLRNQLQGEGEYRARVGGRLRDHEERLTALEEHVERLWSTVLPNRVDS